MAQTARLLAPGAIASYYDTFIREITGNASVVLGLKSDVGGYFTINGAAGVVLVAGSTVYNDKLYLGNAQIVLVPRANLGIVIHDNSYFLVTTLGSFTVTETSKRFTYIEG